MGLSGGYGLSHILHSIHWLKKIKVIGVDGGSLMEVVETKVEDKVKNNIVWIDHNKNNAPI